MEIKKKNKRKRKKIDKDMPIQCSACGKFRARGDFYVSHNDKHADTGVFPYCKNCMRKMCNDKDGVINKEKTLRVLRAIDKPYIHSIWEKVSATGSKNAIGNYLKTINMVQYRDSTWLDGDLDLLTQREANIKPVLTEVKNVEPIKTEIEKFDDFEITDDIIKLFGNGYTEEEYFYMWNKYEFLRGNYTEQTSMHTEALVTYIRYKVKEEIAVAQGKAKEAKTWGELAMKQAERAKINPNQFSKADLQGGLSTIGEIAQAVEQNTDIIPILPQFRYRPNDAVDFCIWNYINYARNLEGKPLVEYKDVYKFYDKMKEDYIASTGDPYGIFANDPTQNNREKVEKFIELPEEYYEEGDKD